MIVLLGSSVGSFWIRVEKACKKLVFKITSKNIFKRLVLYFIKSQECTCKQLSQPLHTDGVVLSRKTPSPFILSLFPSSQYYQETIHKYTVGQC